MTMLMLTIMMTMMLTMMQVNIFLASTLNILYQLYDRKLYSLKRECVNATQPANVKVLSNLRGIGDVIRYNCDVGYTEMHGKPVVAKCLENGKWNATVQCLKVCDEPFIRNAAISSGGTTEGSVRTVTCNGQTTIDVNTVTSDIECMSDGSWNPDITCTKFNSVIFKVVAGNGKSALNAWRNGTESTSDKSCRNISNTNCTHHYRDPRIDEWDTLNVTKVRYSIYKNATEVAWVDFNGTGSSKMDWFQKERVIDSSYTDLTQTSRTNYFGIVPGVLKRHFYASALFNTCEGDKLWFCTIDGEPVCWYDHGAIPNIIYSTRKTMVTSTPGDVKELDFADAATVTINN
ncbi:uncharacterized protein LOC132720794 [Ruditapes philippinarum]|uniref:uncharacterized protein LOC132720794 n=1 Tax=Ruditapes philippinarum TaxID=129788 RepID=UPI00295BB697|nr:uncharacterized protein LOC132720794 [Ruditapes philippinarum]